MTFQLQNPEAPEIEVIPSDLFSTPQALVDAIAEHLGVRFFLDVCATKESTKAPHWMENDGNGGSLTRSWYRKMNYDICTDKTLPRVNAAAWCNPPYSDPAPWYRLAYTESLGGLTTAMLIKHDPSTNYWSRWVPGKAAQVVEIEGRVKFELTPEARAYFEEKARKEGRVFKESSPGFPCAVVVYRPGMWAFPHPSRMKQSGNGQGELV